MHPAPGALLALLLPLALAGCREPSSGFASPTPPPPAVDPDDLCATDGATRCRDGRFQTCVDGEWSSGIACGPPTPRCDDLAGCVPCPAGNAYCVGRDVWSCSDDGAVATFVRACSDTETCLAGACYDACTVAESQLSYAGCGFLAVPTANLLDPAFDEDFAVVVGNPSDVPAEVTIRHRGTLFDVVDVPARDVLAVPLPRHPDLAEAGPSVRVPDGAFELRSSIPVVAYQYEPLHFRVGDAYSYTNDASVLLPEHALGTDHVVFAWPTFGVGEPPALTFDWLPGFVAVVATTNGTQVTVTAAARTEGGTPPAMEPGDERTVSLDRGDVLQLFSAQPTEPLANACDALGGLQSVQAGTEYCLLVADGDLTGTRVLSTQPVAVYAGHTCTYVPFDRPACDHLEESVLPLAAWGREVAVPAVTFPGGTGRARSLLRVIAASPDTSVVFTPAVLPPTLLQPDEVVEVTTDEHVRVVGSAPISVAQLLLGQQALGAELGDPALGTGVPRSQWRPVYDFLVPDTYVENHVALVAAAAARVFLDGAELDGWEAVAGTDLAVARVRVEPGPHRLASVDDAPFGLTSFGYAPYTSYLHPGGLNLLR